MRNSSYILIPILLKLFGPPGFKWCFSFAPELVNYLAPRDLQRRAAYSICESSFLILFIVIFSLLCSLLLKDLSFNFYLLLLQLVLSRVAALKSLPVHRP